MESVTPKSKTNIQKFKDITSWVILVAVFICCLLTAFRVYNMKTTGEQAFLFGYRPALILTGSMEPYMMTNSLCLTKEIKSPDDVEVGDVVSYHVNTNDGDTLRVTHRVIDIVDGKFYTKGDNNRVSDGYGLEFENLEAEVVGVWNGAVPLVEKAFWFAEKWDESITGKIICLSAAVALVCAYNLICMLFETVWAKVTGKNREEEGSLSEVSTSFSEPVHENSDIAAEDTLENS